MATHMHFTKRSKLIEIERLNNSVNGNPRMRLEFDNGITGITKSDAMWVYGIDNGWVDKPVTFEFHYTNAGKCIIDDAKLEKTNA
jgi:hypothetical protein